MWETFFFVNHAENVEVRLTPDLFVFFLKKLYMTLNQAVSILYSICFRSPQFGHTIKTYCMKLQTVDPETCWIFIWQKKGLALVSPPDFVHDFSRKILIILYSMNWPNFIFWLPLLLEIFGNMCFQFVTS